MANGKQVEEVDEGDDYYHVRFRDPDQFSDIRTPDWAENPAESVQEGSEVRVAEPDVVVVVALLDHLDLFSITHICV